MSNMKKTILLVSFIAFAVIAVGQKGSWYIGGMVGYNGSTDKIDSTGKKTVTSSWEASPEIGTFLTKSIQLGIVAGVFGSSVKIADKKNYGYYSPTLQ